MDLVRNLGIILMVTAGKGGLGRMIGVGFLLAKSKLKKELAISELEKGARRNHLK